MKKEITVFSSLEEENRAEDRRRAPMSSAERWDEFAMLKERVFGPN